jgi:MerR family transcriptional regulator, light-induced transcriptional regulator
VSRLLEGRLLTLARGWNKGPGPRAILACPPGEQHTLPLLGFGLALRSRGWRNIYLGADTPPSTVHMAADTVDANMFALAAVSIARFPPSPTSCARWLATGVWCWPAPARRPSWQRTSGSTTSRRTP